MVLILASKSAVRRQLLENAGVEISAVASKVDEGAIKAGMLAVGASARDIADKLAEAKAKKISAKHPGALVLGCDQILAHSGAIMSKAESRNQAATDLKSLRGNQHNLYTAVVLCRDAQPVWRHIGWASLTMRNFSDEYLNAYLDRNWPLVMSAVGCYHVEGEGVRLFSAISGDYFSVLGLPLLALLSYLTTTKEIDG